MGHREEEIENTIRNEVFEKCFGLGDFKKGKDILYKYYLQYYGRLDNFETDRLILYNLIFSECMNKNRDEELVCKWVIQLKNDMDRQPNYKENCTGKYCDMLSYYCDMDSINISKEERLKYYNISYNYYKNLYDNCNSIDTYIRMINIEFSINKIQKNFLNILEIIRDIHKIKDKKATATLKQMLYSIEDMDKQLYNKALKVIEITSKYCI